MAWKQLALAAALLGVANPGEAFDTPFGNRDEAQTVMVYYAIPLDARSKKERMPWMGMQIQGKRDYQSFNLDTRLFTFTDGATAANVAIIGVVAVGAAVAVSARGKSSQQEVQAQQAANPPPPAKTESQSQPQPCPQTCP
jgi:hypothetical protein